VREGDVVKIFLNVTNGENKSLTGVLHDFYPMGADLIDAKPTGMWTPPQVAFDVSMEPYSRKTITYSWTMKYIPVMWNDKKRPVGPATLEDGNGSVLTESTSLYLNFHVETNESCNYNGTCDTELGENYQTCYADCMSGRKDGYCDGVHDYVCDPDCLTQDKDPDCPPETAASITTTTIAATTTTILPTTTESQKDDNLIIYTVLGVVCIIAAIAIIKSRK
jgi:hypothetical protein